MDKRESTDCDFGLGLKMMMMGNHHQDHHHSHNDESGTKFVGFSGGQGTSSPGGCSSGVTGVSGGGIGNLGAMFTGNDQESSVASSVQRSSLAFDPPSLKSWGGVLMGGRGEEMTRVFTPLQRQELERQTIIYKYMVASMPVPPELLISMNSSYPSQLSLPTYQSSYHGSNVVRTGLDLRYAIGSSKDSEPWRCKRTDGKKWRCSRDVAPDQKYCERHSHKGRPSRSRKHVELSSTSPSSTSSSLSIARNNNNNNTLIPSPSSSAVNPANMNTSSSFLYHPSSQSMFMSQHHQNSRLPEWFMKRGQDDQHESTSIPTASSFFPQTELDQITPTRASHNSYMGSNQPHALPRQFLDAWSVGAKPEDIVENTGQPTDSSLLTLSMAGGDGVGLFERERYAAGNERYSSWIGSSGPGGPLAEALCLGIMGPDGGASRGSHGQSESGSGGVQGMGFNK